MSDKNGSVPKEKYRAIMMFWAVGLFFCFLGSVFTKFSNNCSKNDYLLFVCGTCLGTNFGTKIS